MNEDSNNGDNAGGEDPLEKRPEHDQGDTAVPQERDIAQQPQTVDEDFTPRS